MGEIVPQVGTRVFREPQYRIQLAYTVENDQRHPGIRGIESGEGLWGVYVEQTGWFKAKLRLFSKPD